MNKDAWELAPGQHPQHLAKQIQKAVYGLYQFDKTVESRFLLHLPKGYDAPGKKWPLIIFLHGAGESGHDLDMLKRHGPPKIVEQQPDFPFIVISPQAPSPQQGFECDLDILNALLDEALVQLPIDSTRVYLTGMSMGGFATWRWAAADPQRFAAIAPVCGGGNAASAHALKDMPIRAFHGALDDVVPARGSREMVDAVNGCGGRAELTIYPDANHDSWSETYANPALYQWFLQHARPAFQ